MTEKPTPREGQPILFRNGIVLTMDDARTVLPRGDVLVKDGKIAEVGVDVEAPDDAFVIDALVDVRLEIDELLAAEGLGGHDRPVLDELLIGCFADGVGESELTDDLGRALMEHGCSRMDGRAPVAFDDQIAHTVRTEQQGCGQTDQASAGDEHRHLDFVHRTSLDSTSAWSTRGAKMSSMTEQQASMSG